MHILCTTFHNTAQPQANDIDFPVLFHVDNYILVSLSCIYSMRRYAELMLLLMNFNTVRSSA